MSRARILYVCVHNAGRSQIAAAFTRKLGGNKVEVVSGGTEPAERIHPTVEEAMAELGIDVSKIKPRKIEDADAEGAAAVITMGCGDACPVFPGKRYEDWKLEDPAGKKIEEVRKIRDVIRLRVETLLAEMGVTGK